MAKKPTNSSSQKFEFDTFRRRKERILFKLRWIFVCGCDWDESDRIWPSQPRKLSNTILHIFLFHNLNLFSEAFHLKENTFIVNPNDLAYFNWKKSWLLEKKMFSATNTTILLSINSNYLRPTFCVCQPSLQPLENPYGSNWGGC